jgi:hypothetical protein
MPERDSDLVSAAELLGVRRKLRVWPPEVPAPGVKFVLRQAKKREGEKGPHRSIITVPHVSDPVAFYGAIHERVTEQEAEETDRRRVRYCGTCNNARWVRYERPVSHPMFAKMTPCPRGCWKP